MEQKLSDIIHIERHKRRETLKKTGESIGCTAIYLSNIETGKRLPMDGAIISKIANHFKIDFSMLMRAAYNQKCEEIIEKYKGGTVD